jgi:hypothetical protein
MKQGFGNFSARYGSKAYRTTLGRVTISPPLTERALVASHVYRVVRAAGKAALPDFVKPD